MGVRVQGVRVAEGRSESQEVGFGSGRDGKEWCKWALSVSQEKLEIGKLKGS